LTIAELMARIESSEAEQEKEVEVPPGEKTTYMVASAGKALKSGQALGADTIIVDPPRKGLEPEVLDELCKPVDVDQMYVEDVSVLTVPDEQVKWTNDARTLIYVSCGFDALARDAERLLTSNAGWMLESATGYILFPGSDHVETVCVFTRRGG
jgi:tRNA/tmRNA/rRNA uracil-C5-methylase (TrmA/RlmC/RlmD family)